VAPGTKSRSFLIRLLGSLAVSAVLIALTLRKVDLAAVGQALANAHSEPLLGYVAILLAVHVVKTVRWWLLILPLGPVSFRRVNVASAVGLMLLALMPLRLGELARPLIVSRATSEGEVPLRRSAALASCVVERLCDSIAMSVLAIVSLRWLAVSGHTADVARHAATLGALGFGGGAVALAFAFLARERAMKLLRGAISVVSPKLADRVVKLVDGFIIGLHLGSVFNVIGFLALTAVYWGLLIVAYWWVAQAFDLPLTPLMACTVLACQVIGSMIPAGPGMVGTSQFFTQLGISIFFAGAFTAPELAPRVVAYANAIWAIQFAQQMLVGLPFLISGRVKVTGRFSPHEPLTNAAETAS